MASKKTYRLYQYQSNALATRRGAPRKGDWVVQKQVPYGAHKTKWVNCSAPRKSEQEARDLMEQMKTSLTYNVYLCDGPGSMLSHFTRSYIGFAAALDLQIPHQAKLLALVQNEDSIELWWVEGTEGLEELRRYYANTFPHTINPDTEVVDILITPIPTRALAGSEVS